jgi:hypothetical protein
MGQARRRKLTGTYPDPDIPLTKARRFWCGRDQVAAEDFVVPEGIVAITMDVDGAPPSTCLFEATAAVDIEGYVQSAMDKIPDNPGYRRFVAVLAEVFLKARQSRDDSELEPIGCAAFWTVLNHPQMGGQARQAISAQLRRDGKTHITWRFGKDGLGISVGERFADMEKIAALAPKDRVFAYVAGIGKAERGH